MSDIFQSLKKILADEIGIKEEISEQTALLSDLGLDSMDFVNYVVNVENTFGIKIPDEDIQKHELGIMGNMVKYIKNKKS
jgi:acyl carrier protein